MDDEGLLLRVLGPLEVSAGGRPVPLEAPRLRLVLALLVAGGGRVVSVAALAEELWGVRRPAGAERTVRVYVSLLRTALRPLDGADAVATRPPGYLLRVPPGAVDAVQFERLATAGRLALQRGEPAVAARVLAAALVLWRGEAYAEFDDSSVLLAEAARLEQLRLAAVQDRIEADLAAGCGAELVGELEALTRTYPSFERLWGQLMTALYRCGRQADALEAYRRARQTLVDRFGLEPTPTLTALHHRILSQDARLLAPVG
ncbi:MAG: hypothetical protein V7637_2848 [Mycobacteriales bacterium]